MAGKICAICGKPSGMYPLCFACMKEKNNGNIVKCEECNTWHKINEPCKCNNKGKEIKEATESNSLKCIICGENEAFNNSHFCKSCYTKYKQKAITVQITNCNKVSIVDEYGNKTYKNDAGIFVRSTQELIVSNALFNKNIRFVYEKTLPYKKEDGSYGELHPDFYLIDYDLYLEHWGIVNNEEYEQTREYKERIYNQLGKKVAGTTPNDLKDISAAIDKILIMNS